MPLSFLSFEEFVSIVVAEFRTENPDIDPTVDEYSRGWNTGLAAACLSLQNLIRDLEREAFPQTATGTDLDKWGGYEILPRNPTTSSTGKISLPGTVAGTIILINQEFTSNGFIYSSTIASTVQDITDTISSMTRSGSIVSVETVNDHSLATGMEVTIAGANETDYNGLFPIIVTGSDTFSYTIDASPTTPATGTITFQSIFASINVQCDSTGLDTNLDQGAVLTLSPPAISGAGLSAYVQFEGLTGGTDVETNEEYRSRILLSRSLLEGVFTRGQVELAALTISGNTRAYVISPGLSVCAGSTAVPVPGQVTVYILRDNDSNILPVQSILDETKQAIIDLGKLPAHTSEIDLFVLAPTLVETDFDFATLVPDSSTMRTAVEANLQAFFEDSVAFGIDVAESKYLAAIANTQDLVTGEFVETFSLTAPTGDIAVTVGEIASLGDVTYA